MNLFNKKLLNQHIARYQFPTGDKLNDIQKLLQGWEKALKDSNLDKTKEKSVQGQFLNKFFENILGYETQTSGNEEWHLIQEPTSEVDSDEADGSLGFFSKDSNKVRAVIELKDAKTPLDKKQSSRHDKLTPVEQGFKYLNKFDGCKWVIVSNFREIRLYSKSRGIGYYEKFEIIGLSEEENFKKFYYLLNKENLIDEGHTSAVDLLVKDTTEQEEDITKKFYSEYKEIRFKLLNHIFDNNPDVDKLLIVEKTQKLLDRLIFTMVCEDSSTLLPAHLVKNTYETAFKSFALSDSEDRVWTEFKGLFNAIDKGNSDVKPPINEYNGGLFRKDDVLDNLIIKDDIWEEIIKLSKYDFESDLNVNLLGHIFEQSISDLEEIKASVNENGVFEKRKSKRKKQGIFYTPEYITDYIVEQTVGKFLEDNPEKLEDIKILDPACGSGAFLNQAHSYLLIEYKNRTEEKQIEKREKGERITLWDTNVVENDKSILLNNLYGVDLSPESVDITKLALWIKTAKATEKLQNLNENVKCGNSLVSDPEIAKDKAFDWRNEYKTILDNGGFDVIVGNPPYVQLSKLEATTDAEKDYLTNRFETSSGRLNTFGFFILLGLELLNEGGYLGYIIPNTILTQDYYSKIREEILKKSEICEIVNYPSMPFEDAVVENVTIILKKKKPSKDHSVRISEQNFYITEQKKSFLQNRFNTDEKKIFDIRGDEVVFSIDDQKIEYTFGDVCNINQAIALKGDKTESITKNPNAQGDIYPLLDGKNVKRYAISFSNDYLIYDLEKIHSCKSKDIFLKDEKILFRRVGSSIVAAYDNKKYFALNTCVVVTVKDDFVNKFNLKYILGLLNSKLVNHYYTNKYKSTKKVFSEIQARSIGRVPIVMADTDLQNQVCNYVDEIIKTKSNFISEKSRRLDILLSKFNVRPSKKIRKYHELGWNEFVEELEKQNRFLEDSVLDDTNKWFIEMKEPLNQENEKLLKLEKNLDSIVYDIYKVKDKEIKIVESYYNKNE